METNVIFTKFEVIGATKDIAKENAEGLTLMVDATQAYKKWAKDHVTNEDNVKDWMKDYLKGKKFDKAGLGAYIVTQSHIADTRERPYKLEDVKYEAKTHTPESFYVLRDETGHEVGREKTKEAAKQAAREYITEYREDVTCTREWAPKEKNALVFTGKYTPSKGAQPCKILAFGYKVVD